MHIVFNSLFSLRFTQLIVSANICLFVFWRKTQPPDPPSHRFRHSTNPPSEQPNKNRTRYTSSRLHRNAMGGGAAGEGERERGGSEAMWGEAYFVLRVCPGSGNILHVCIQNIIFAEIVSLKKQGRWCKHISLAVAAAKVELPFGYTSTCLALAPERTHTHTHTRAHWQTDTHACAIKWSYYRKKR